MTFVQPSVPGTVGVVASYSVQDIGVSELNFIHFVNILEFFLLSDRCVVMRLRAEQSRGISIS